MRRMSAVARRVVDREVVVSDCPWYVMFNTSSFTPFLHPRREPQQASPPWLGFNSNVSSSARTIMVFGATTE